MLLLSVWAWEDEEESELKELEILTEEVEVSLPSEDELLSVMDSRVRSPLVKGDEAQV